MSTIVRARQMRGLAGVSPLRRRACRRANNRRRDCRECATSWLTSARRGRFSSVSVWSVSRQAIISGSAAFLAPEIGIVAVELGAAANLNAIHSPDPSDPNANRVISPPLSPRRSVATTARRRAVVGRRRAGVARRRGAAAPCAASDSPAAKPPDAARRLSWLALPASSGSCRPQRVRRHASRPRRRLIGPSRTSGASPSRADEAGPCRDHPRLFDQALWRPRAPRAVISAPASMRAISSRRSRGSRRARGSATRSPLPTSLLAIRKWLVRPRGDLRRVGDGEHLRARGEPRQALADRVGDGAADAGVDLVEHQGRRGAALGERDFDRQQEARQFAAGGDFHQRARPRAGIGAARRIPRGRSPSGDTRPRRCASSTMNARALELQRRQLRRRPPLELARARPARRWKRAGGRARSRRASATRLARAGDLAPASVEAARSSAYFCGQRRQAIDRRAVFARHAAQREQPLLAALELVRIEVAGLATPASTARGRAARALRSPRRAPSRRARSDAGACGIRRSSRRAAAASTGRIGGVAGQVLVRLADVRGDLLALHHR